MPRYVFYFAAAFAAFVIGTFLAPGFYGNEEKNHAETNVRLRAPEIKPPPGGAQTETVSVQKDNVQVNSFSEAEFYENEESALKPFVRRWANGGKIKQRMISIATLKEAEPGDFDAFLPSLIDVNADGKKELAIRYGCSPTGNCDFLIYEKIGKSFRRILKDVHGVQVFSLGGKAFRNYKDIETRMHGSWNSGDGVIYRFDGKQYQPSQCFRYVYEEYTDGKGERATRDKPTLRYFSCKLFD